jgi:hypothetical protein
MAPYRITLHGPAGSLIEERTYTFEHDDAAIDCAGGIDHPGVMKVWRGDTLIAEFPAPLSFERT